MSTTAAPIAPARFAAALTQLPLSALHSKAAEIRNSRAHLRSSNEQLQAFADEADGVCKEAIAENEEVLRRMEERLGMLRRELEGRGMSWVEEDALPKDETGVGESHVVVAENGIQDGDEERAGTDFVGQSESQRSGRYTDEELQRRLMDQIGGDGEDGLHL